MLVSDFNTDFKEYLSDEDIIGANDAIMKKLGEILVNRKKEFIDLLNESGIEADISMPNNQLIELFIDNCDNKFLLLGASLLVNLEKSTSYIYIDNRVHQNAGATIPQQLSYALSQSVDYLSRINSSSEAVEVVFHLALGPNYFFEIAKIQALKTVFSAVLAVYDFKINYKVIAEPSERNLTLQDYNINMLRSTTAMMAGILGGADVLNNLPYDIAFNTPNEFGDRIAQNQLLILKKESFFDQVTNPAEGSYYIEQLTQEFAEYALTGFKEIESKKGFLSLLLVEEIQKQISKSAQKEQDLFDSGALVLVGINRFQDYDAPKTKSTRIDKTYNDKILIEPIRGIRLSENTEQHNGK